MVSQITTVTGSFNYTSENFNYYGNFIARRNRNYIELKIYGPFGVSGRSFQVNLDTFKSPLIRYIMGLEDTLTGRVLKSGNMVVFDRYRIVYGDSGDILSVTTSDIKIFLKHYKKVDGFRVPFKIKAFYKNSELDVNLKEVRVR